MKTAPAKLTSMAVRVIVALLATVSLYRLCWIPYRCNRYAKTAEALTVRAENAGVIEASSLARRNVDLLNTSLERCACDVRLLVLLAVNYRLLDNPRDAITAYERALRLDKRPEIYFELGLTQLSLGDRTGAIVNLTKAARFAEQYMYETEDPSMIDAVRRNLGLQPLQR